MLAFIGAIGTVITIGICLIPVIIWHIRDSKKEKERLKNDFLESLKEKKK